MAGRSQCRSKARRRGCALRRRNQGRLPGGAGGEHVVAARSAFEGGAADGEAKYCALRRGAGRTSEGGRLWLASRRTRKWTRGGRSEKGGRGASQCIAASILRDEGPRRHHPPVSPRQEPEPWRPVLPAARRSTASHCYRELQCSRPSLDECGMMREKLYDKVAETNDIATI